MIVEFLEAFISEPEDVETGFVAVQFIPRFEIVVSSKSAPELYSRSPCPLFSPGPDASQGAQEFH
jgi:hypothetical protein